MQDDTMAFLFAGRTAPHGYNVETEIVGTKATLRIGSVPQKNLVEILDDSGVRKECSQDFVERFDSAYLAEMNEFIRCIFTGEKPDISVYDGTNATRISDGCRTAFQTGEIFRFYN
jgi:myo-inositol 2-dehydrogenase/D-chiro-inositol 1-dehydrogenase